MCDCRCGPFLDSFVDRDSWYYCYAGLGVMIFSYIGRLYFKWRMTGVTTIPAEVEVLNSQVTRLSVDARAGW